MNHSFTLINAIQKLISSSSKIKTAVISYFTIMILVFICKVNNAQVPILYYDFENNSARTSFENSVEQAVNIGSGALTRSGNATTISSVAGAGIFNGGSLAGEAITGNSWSNATSFAGTGATDYYQFIVNVSGFSDIDVSFDNQSSLTGPARVGVLYSIDGSTFKPAMVMGNSTVLTGNNAFSNSGRFSLSTDANNQAAITIRIFAYAGNSTDRSGRSAFSSSGTFRIDNLTMSALTVTGSVSLLNFPNIGLSIKSGAAFTPSYQELYINGSGINVNLISNIVLSGRLSLLSGTLNCGNYLIDGTGVLVNVE